MLPRGEDTEVRPNLRKAVLKITPTTLSKPTKQRDSVYFHINQQKHQLFETYELDQYNDGSE